MRTVVGGLFVGHGMQKLAGWFGGSGLDGTEKMMDALEMRPTRTNAIAAGLTETVSGAMLTLGMGTPAAAAGITGVMTTAIRKVHGANGVWNSNGGYEYNTLILAAVFALAEKPGRYSVDAAFGHSTWGTRWAIAALATGILGSTAAIKAGSRVGGAAPGAE